MTTLQEAAAKLMEAMQDEADLARRKDQALLDALAPRPPAAAGDDGNVVAKKGKRK